MLLFGPKGIFIKAFRFLLTFKKSVITLAFFLKIPSRKIRIPHWPFELPAKYWLSDIRTVWNNHIGEKYSSKKVRLLDSLKYYMYLVSPAPIFCLITLCRQNPSRDFNFVHILKSPHKYRNYFCCFPRHK